MSFAHSFEAAMLQSRLLLMEKVLQQSPHPRYMQAKLNVTTKRGFKSYSTKQASALPPPDHNKAPIQMQLPDQHWLWTPLQPLSYPFKAYSRATKSRPYPTQFISSLVIYFLGDLSSQYIQQWVPAPPIDASAATQTPTTTRSTQACTPTTQSTYDMHRSIRALIIGGTISIPSYLWFMYLSRLWPTLPHMISLWMKVGLNTVVFAPVLNTYFFTVHSVLSGDSGYTWQAKAEAAWVRVKNTVPRSWLKGCLFWPAVTAFSFSFVPPMHRSIFAGVAAIGWQTYLGLLNQRAKMKEVNTDTDI